MGKLNIKNIMLSIGSSFSEKKTIFKDSIITSKMVGKVFLIHNGKLFVEKKITKQMVNLKAGELVLTRALFQHERKKKSSKKKKKKAF